MLLVILSLILIILILIKLYIKLTTGKCVSPIPLTGKTVIITGANTGIGKATAIDLAKRGAKLILACRNLQAAEIAKLDIIKASRNKKIIVHKLDLASFESVRDFSKIIHETEPGLDILINNAGASYLGNSLTVDGINSTMQVNYFGPFLLTNLLLDLLIKSAPSRIVNVSSVLHSHARLNLNNIRLNEENQKDVMVYCNSKLCNLLMSNELARRLEDKFVTSNSLHPGVVDTQLFQHMPWYKRYVMEFFAKIYFKTVTEGAQTSIYLAVAEDVKHVSGEYFADCIEAKMSDCAQDEELAKKLWQLSEVTVKLQPNEKLLI